MSALIELPCPASPRVSVIVTASARLDLLQACLRSVARCGPRTIPYETIVVLNRSLPHTEAQLRGVITGAHVISSPVNLGIAGSNNRGRHLARGELLLLLHDDTEVEPGWMEALVETVDAHPHAGAIGGKVLFPDEPVAILRQRPEAGEADDVHRRGSAKRARPTRSTGCAPSITAGRDR